MAQEACHPAAAIRFENGTFFDFDIDTDTFPITPNFTDVDSIKASLEPHKRRVENCWTCDDCDFQLSEVQPDGNRSTYHFLEYSGSRQLAEDMERIRILFRAPVLHLYGVSYGTQGKFK